MSREIKLRMWSTLAKKFFDKTNVYECLKQQMTGYWDHEDMIWQRFTGFFDKNGKEIFEGDIVLDNFYGDKTARVIYDLGCFWLNSEHLGEGLERELYDSVPEKLEVIGNLCENPELLK